MLHTLRNLPIKHKLMALTVGISGVALVLACAAFAIYEQTVFRRTMARDFAILADMFEANVAAGLAFNDPAAIEKTLTTLSANARIVAACVYDKQGAAIGVYRRPGAAAGGEFQFPTAQPTSQHFGPDRLDTFQDITLAGEIIGVVYIGVELTELRERAWRYVIFVGLLLIACSLVALLLAARLQRIISQPILDLAQTVATVAKDKNYAMRAPKESDDELGHLIDGFNEMLAQIQARDIALQGARDQLEERVAERTRELQQEIVERRRAEESLRLLSSAVEQARESILITDAELNLPGPKIVFVNPAFTQMTGYPAAEALGKTPRILQGPRTERAVLDRLRKNLEHGEVFAGEAINYRKDGTEFFIEWQAAPLRDASGTITHFVAIQRDITERKKTEMALQDSEERYRSVIDNATDAIFTVAADGTFTSLNRAVEKIAGLSRSAWLGRPFMAMVDPADLPVAQDMFRRIMNGEPAPVHELRGNPSLARPAIMEMTLVAQKDKGGKIIGVQGVGRDVTARKQAEAGRERLAAILEATTDFVGFTDPAGHVLYINRAGRALLGVSADEDIHQLTISDLIPHSENNIILTEGIPRAIRDGTWSGETVLLSRSGREIPVSQVILAHKSPDGKLEFISTIMRDVTASKRAAAELANSLSVLHATLESTVDGILVVDSHGQLTTFNRKFVEMWRIPADALASRDSARIIGAVETQLKDPESYVSTARQLYANPEAENFEVLEFKDGRIFERYSQAQRVNGVTVGRVSCFRDITVRTHAEEELRSKTALLEAQINASIDGILIVDNEGRKLIQNKRLIELWKIPPEIAGENEDEHQVQFVATQTKLPDQFAARVSYLNLHPDESSRDEVELKDGMVLDRYSTPVVGRDGKHYGRLWGFRDITPRKQAEAALEKAHLEMVGVSRQAGMAEVAIGVLHNVGNVLNSVNVSATLIADQVRQTEAGNIAKLAAMFDQHQTDLAAFLTTDPRGRIIPGYLGTLAKSLATERTATLSEVDQLRKNIDHIKEIVAMQQTYARTSGVVETFSVADLIEDAVRIDVDSLARHGVEMIRDFQARPVVTTDKHQVMQILINLLRNAKQACDESGHPGGKITLRLTSDDRAAKIAVSDNGIGIPAENLARIFNFGFTTRKNGHGFGLHSSALVAKELGGSLTVQSDGPGRGATFILDLPCQPDLPRP